MCVRVERFDSPFCLVDDRLGDYWKFSLWLNVTVVMQRLPPRATSCSSGGLPCREGCAGYRQVAGASTVH